MKKSAIVFFILGTTLLLSGAMSMATETELKDGLYAKFVTSKGDILCELEFEKTPLTVINFVGLAEGTMAFGGSTTKGNTRFYDGLTFHRVIDNFMIQGGCPLGTGTGGPGYKFEDEIHPDLKHDRPGILSMANAGPGTNGSQFFITHVPTPHLDGKHTVFGHVVKGQDVVNAIKKGDTIKTIEIIRVGEKAEQFQADQAAFDTQQAKIKSEQSEKNKEKNKKTEELIKQKWPKAKTTKSGLKYIVKTEGKGETPAKGTTITAHYTGKLLNGTKFDSSYDRGEPIKFPIGVGRVIPGWDEALLAMKKGEKRVLIIPPGLAYGERGAGGVIPPNAWLVFDVELVDF